MKPMDTLHNLSGGLDSVYCMWKYLKENPNKTLLVHHCNLINNQNRYELESEATKKVIEWFKANGLSNFEYLETTIDIRQLGTRPLDYQVIAFMNGILFINKKYQRIKYRLICTPKDEYDRLGNPFLIEQLTKFNNILKQPSITAKPHNVQPKLIIMLKDRYKLEYINEMPKELVKLSWSCRIPNGNQYCGRCHTCLQLKLG